MRSILLFEDEFDDDDGAQEDDDTQQQHTTASCLNLLSVLLLQPHTTPHNYLLCTH